MGGLGKKFKKNQTKWRFFLNLFFVYLFFFIYLFFIYFIYFFFLLLGRAPYIPKYMSLLPSSPKIIENQPRTNRANLFSKVKVIKMHFIVQFCVTMAGNVDRECAKRIQCHTGYKYCLEVSLKYLFAK